MKTAHFIDTDHICYRCRAFDREVNAYQPYFHFCFIPCFPTGAKSIEMRCRSCGDDTRLETVLSDHPVSRRPAWYLFSGPMLIAVIAIAWFFWNRNMVRESAKYLSNPLIGDMYSIREKVSGGTNYHFLRVAAVAPDSLLMLENHLEYTGFVSDLADDDYFDRGDTLSLSRRKLRDMQIDGVLWRIERQYRKNAGFNRVR